MARAFGAIRSAAEADRKFALVPRAVHQIDDREDDRFGQMAGQPSVWTLRNRIAALASALMNEPVEVEYRVDRILSPSDGMFEGNTEHYFGVGLSAITNILNAIRVAKAKPDSILDFGCGAGRVTRWIVAAFPNARIEGCDIRKADIEFVADAFGVRTWQSGTDVAKLNPPSSYDLIWVGSVFTHLSMPDSVALFDRLFSWLNPGGVLVFTSHGRHAANQGPSAGFYGIPARWQRVKADFEKSQYGYADYASTPGYGISLVKMQWWAGLITSRPAGRLILMTEQAWDNHQDVIGVQRTGSLPIA